jgi:hypothetical protein
MFSFAKTMTNRMPVAKLLVRAAHAFFCQPDNTRKTTCCLFVLVREATDLQAET